MWRKTWMELEWIEINFNRFLNHATRLELWVLKLCKAFVDHRLKTKFILNSIECYTYLFPISTSLSTFFFLMTISCNIVCDDCIFLAPFTFWSLYALMRTWELFLSPISRLIHKFLFSCPFRNTSSAVFLLQFSHKHL